MFNTIKYNIFNNWNPVRWFRFAISIFIVVQAFQMHDLLIGFLGCFFLFQSLINTGCCSASSCVPSVQKEKDDKEQIEFSEVKNN